MRRGVFVTGTDTDVGKTIVACGLVRALARGGMCVAAYKPVEAGGHTDAVALWEASGRFGPEEDVCRVRLAMAAAPSVAAREEEARIEREDLLDGFRRQAARSEYVVVEGAGGLLVPLAEDLLVADLARDLELPVLVVARDALGTINHTLLTAEAARGRGLKVEGIVLNRVTNVADATTKTNREVLDGLAGVPVVGPFPHLDPPSHEAAADAVDALGLAERLGLR